MEYSLDDKLDIDPGDFAKRMPAARCRECGAVTWTVSIAEGLRRREEPHDEECSKPLGRIDVLVQVPLAKRESFLEGRLLRPMNNAQVEEAAAVVMNLAATKEARKLWNPKV